MQLNPGIFCHESVNSMFHKISSDYIDYLHDESRQSGNADSIVFACSTDDVVSLMRSTADAGTPITTQGGRTGITAGAVPAGGCILNE
jgi:D-lactate dehydrogenase (cytochrome)